MRRVNWDDQMWELKVAGTECRWAVGRRRGRRRRLGDAVAGVQDNAFAPGDSRALVGVDVQATVVASLTGNEVSAAVVLELTTGGDREACGGSGTYITLPLRGWC